ncbi:MAG: hypothetical protein WBL28_10555 [Methylotenera sp.]
MNFKNNTLVVATSLTFILSACAGQPIASATKFEGKWKSTLSDAKGQLFAVYSIHQKDSRACGWSLTYHKDAPPSADDEAPQSAGWANPTEVKDGRFVGEITGNKLTINKICGDASPTKTPCPESSLSKLTKEVGIDEKWTSVSKVFWLCSNALYYSKDVLNSCTNVDATKTIRFLKDNESSEDPNLEYPATVNINSKTDDTRYKAEQEWLKNCLNGKDN